MRNKYSLIIVILVAGLLLSGAALFLARNQVVAWFDNHEDLASLAKPAVIPPSKNTIDDSVIKSERFKSLKNNVINFDFLNICKRPIKVAVVNQVAVSNPDGTAASSTPPENINCRQGNNNPFFVKKK